MKMIVIVSQKAKMLCFLDKILLTSIYAHQSCFKLKLVTLYKFIDKDVLMVFQGPGKLPGRETSL